MAWAGLLPGCTHTPDVRRGETPPSALVTVLALTAHRELAVASWVCAHHLVFAYFISTTRLSSAVDISGVDRTRAGRVAVGPSCALRRATSDLDFGTLRSALWLDSAPAALRPAPCAVCVARREPMPTVSRSPRAAHVYVLTYSSGASSFQGVWCLESRGVVGKN